MTSFSDEILSKNDFETVLVTFCCYDYGVKTSKGKITTDQKDSQKCSLCVIVCCIPKISSVTVKKIGYLDTSAVAKKTAEVAQKRKQ